MNITMTVGFCVSRIAIKRSQELLFLGLGSPGAWARSVETEMEDYLI